ncbi:hypothetical protein A6F59_14880 [Prescottella equi]|nr:hypothetical protein A6F59_14880 [Prescottella equi]
MSEEKTGRARGGQARAAKLTQSERSEIARKAAKERWSQDVVKAVCGSPDKPLTIGDTQIECYVLEDGTRVVSQASFMQAIGRHPRGGGPASGDEPLPPFLQTKSIRNYLTDEIIEGSKPIAFTLPRGGRARGYRAELLPVVCEIYLMARQDGVLPPNQEHVAKKAEILVRGLARVGIIALVDEATGYQEMRAKDALEQILETYVAKELQAWVRTFPEDYYREIFRLRGLSFPESTVRRPQYFGVLTNDIVYKRLAPGVLEELKRVQRRSESGRPKDKLFQKLTTNVGYPKLREHLGSVVTLMKLSTDWDDFKTKLDAIHPRVGDTIQIQYEHDSKTGL